MKRKINVKNIGRVFGIVALFTIVTGGASLAATVTKPFEIGEGRHSVVPISALLPCRAACPSPR